MRTIFRTFSAVPLCLAFLLLIPLAHAQKKNSPTAPDRERERRSQAVNVVRAINTAEMNYKKNHGAYATWDTLIANGDFTETGTKWAPESFPTVAHAMYGTGAEIIPGWRLRLQLSKEGNAYDLTLEDVNDPKCGFAVTSNEGGLIRQGKTIDCPI
jgi:hypothetical protein